MSDDQIKAVILQPYYDLSAKSAIGTAPHFEIVRFRFAFDFIDESGEFPVLKTIPAETDSIDLPWFTGIPQMSYSNGRTLITCEMPKGTITENVTKKYSCVGIYVAGESGLEVDDILVAVLLGQLAYLTNADNHTVQTYLDNTLAGCA